MAKLGMQVLQGILICHGKWTSVTGYSGFRWYSANSSLFLRYRKVFYCLHNRMSLTWCFS